MTCKNCGANIPEGAQFCVNCGAPAPQPEPVYQQPVYTYEQSAPVEPSVSATSVLIFGILGLAFGWTGVSSLVGLIFSIIGLSKAKKYAAEVGELTGKAKIGKILSTIGLVVAILAMVAAVLVVLYYVIFIVIIGGAALSSNYYY